MPENKSTAAHVFEAINAITAEFAKEGIAKTRSVSRGESYKFRGIEDVMASLCHKLADHKLIITPRVVGRDVRQATTKSGGSMVYTVLDVEFDFVSAKDGTVHTVRTVGEAMDVSDKSSNKAMSIAYKYMALLTFCIPVQGDDTEEFNHEMQNAAAPAAKAISPAKGASIIPVGLTDDGNTNWTEWSAKMIAAINASTTLAQINNVLVANKNAITQAKADFKDGYTTLENAANARRASLPKEIPTLKKD